MANLRDGRGLLADRDIDTNNVLAFLVDDRVYRDGGFARLAVADDKLALTAPDRHHRVNGFQACLKRLFYRLAVNNSRSDPLYRKISVGHDLAFAIDRIAQSVNNAADQRIAYGHAHDALCALGFVALFDLLKIAEKHAPDLVLLEVEREAANAVVKFQKFAGHDFFEAVNFSDAVADLDNSADLVDGHRCVKILDLCTNYLVDFVCFD